MTRIDINIQDVRGVAERCLLANGCNGENAGAIAETIFRAELDHCESHGLFRLPGYVASLRSGKVNGQANPRMESLAPGVLRIDSDGGFAPLALEHGLPPLAERASEQGLAALVLVDVYHFAALWPEAETLAEMGYCALAMTTSKPAVAPAGGAKPFFGTDPMAFGWPRPDGRPMVFDQATSVRAKGDVMIAARDGHRLPDGVGIDTDGNPTNDADEILKGALLPFGGYKGSAIAMMIELMAAGLIGETFGYEAGERDNNDGGPARGGELIIAMDPKRFGDADNWQAHAEHFFANLTAEAGVRLPGDRRYEHRQSGEDTISVPEALYREIESLTGT